MSTCGEKADVVHMGDSREDTERKLAAVIPSSRYLPRMRCVTMVRNVIPSTNKFDLFQKIVPSTNYHTSIMI